MSRKPLVRIIRRTIEVVDENEKKQETEMHLGGCFYGAAVIVIGVVCGSVMFSLILGPAGLVIGVPAGFIGSLVMLFSEGLEYRK